MPNRKFSVRMSSSGDQNDRATHSIHVAAIAPAAQSQARYNILDSIPVHAAADVSSDTAADCHLQLWELDYYHTLAWLPDEETDTHESANRLVAALPGVMVKLETNEYRFRLAGDFAPGDVDPMTGKVILALERAGEESASNVVVPMPEFESVLELYPILKAAAEDAAVETYRDASVYQVRNIEASLRRQIAERGGFAASFVVDFGANPPNNNLEFSRQAEEMIATLPTFKVIGGEVQMGYHLWSSYAQLGDRLTELRDAVKDLLGLEEAPKVAVLALYGHGLRQKLLINAAGYDAAGSLRPDRVPEFVQIVKDHLCESPVIALFACNTGAGANPNPEAESRYGRAPPCEELGGDSLAWTLFRQLVHDEVPNPTVWGHTTAAHTTRNPKLRVFSNFGTADFVNALFETPRLQDATLTPYLTAVRPLETNSPAQDALYRQRLHNANLIRRISLQHAMYLPWSWSGGEDGTDSSTGWTEEAHTEARHVFEELRALVAGAPVSMQDEVTFEDDHRTFISGLRQGVTAASLSQNFAYSEIAPLADPMRVSVKLMRAVQLVRYRGGHGLSPQALRAGGEEIALRVQPDTAAVRNAVLAHAQRLVDQGLLTSAAIADGLLTLSVAGA